MTPFDLPLDDYRFEVEVPPVHVSTREAYSGVTPRVPEITLEEALRRPVSQWNGLVINGFEESVFPLHPELAAVKQRMYARGALYASLSGSGSSIFGIFPR